MKSKDLRKESVGQSIDIKPFGDNLSEFPETEKVTEFDEFGNLRSLLLSQEQDKISLLESKVKTLQAQLDSLPPATPEEVSDVLPRAIKQRNLLNNQLAKATLPIVEDNIRQSVKANPQVLAEALFPAIGPAIRKAIADALGAMVQSLNQTIEYSFSPRSIKWRIEAWQTGKSFGEVVLLNTLLYRVEEIFLIHKETGLLVQHVSANIGKGQDADMVSAMLTAIQDFVRDSFSNSSDANLDTLTLGDLSVWIERSQNLLFAAVIRGNAPFSLREKFKTAVEEIELENEEELVDFRGNADSFEQSRPILQDCLEYQIDGETSKKSNVFSPFNIGLASLGLILCVFGFFWIRDYWRWSGYVSRLETETGIVVTEAERGWFTHSIQGLRDPFSIDPVNLQKEYNVNPEKTNSHWEEYQSSNSEFVLRRLKKLLNPPETVSISFSDGILTLDGDATKSWFDDAKRISSSIVGVKEVRVNTTAIPQLIQQIESQKIEFICKTSEYAEAQTSSIAKLSEELVQLKNSIIQSNHKLRIIIRGSSDANGEASINEKISIKRAETLSNSLASNSAELKAVKMETTSSPDGFIGCAARIEVILE
jgi:outer membrane protein OmpA-like peptidoglycan-associated protein